MKQASGPRDDELFEAIDPERYDLDDPDFRAACRASLEAEGALVLPGFFSDQMVDDVLADSVPRIGEAFFTTDSTHNVYLTPPDEGLPAGHAFNRQVVSTKGCLAHDQVPSSSPLRTVYESDRFRRFVAHVVDVGSVHPYADTVSGINVHFHLDKQELGWHFDNSAFAVTSLMQAAESGGAFEYVPNLRDADAGDLNVGVVEAILDGAAPGRIRSLAFDPGALVMFRGRNSMHRVTPSRGTVPRVLVVFAYNTEPGIGLSESAKMTFYGRSG